MHNKEKVIKSKHKNRQIWLIVLIISLLIAFVAVGVTVINNKSSYTIMTSAKYPLEGEEVNYTIESVTCEYNKQAYIQSMFIETYTEFEQYKNEFEKIKINGVSATEYFNRKYFKSHDLAIFVHDDLDSGTFHTINSVTKIKNKVNININRIITDGGKYSSSVTFDFITLDKKTKHVNFNIITFNVDSYVNGDSTTFIADRDICVDGLDITRVPSECVIRFGYSYVNSPEHIENVFIKTYDDFKKYINQFGEVTIGEKNALEFFNEDYFKKHALAINAYNVETDTLPWYDEVFNTVRYSPYWYKCEIDTVTKNANQINITIRRQLETDKFKEFKPKVAFNFITVDPNIEHVNFNIHVVQYVQYTESDIYTFYRLY